MLNEHAALLFLGVGYFTAPFIILLVNYPRLKSRA